MEVPPDLKQAPVLQLVDARLGEVRSEIETATATVGGAGRFEFPNVAPGQYFIRSVNFPMWTGPADGAMRYNSQTILTDVVLAPVPSAPTWWVDEPVSVD